MKATLWLSLFFAIFWLGTSQVLYKTRYYGPAYDRTTGIKDTNYCPAANPTDDESVQVASYISRWTNTMSGQPADCPATTYGSKTGYTTTGFADLSLFCNHKTIAGVGLADCSDTVATGTGACAYSNFGTYIGILFRTYGTIYSYNFRYGPSATCGGLMYIDGQLVNMNSVAMENGNQWTDPTQYLQATAAQLPKNTWHSIEVMTFESNGDTQQSLQYRTATNQNFTGFKHDGVKVGLNYATRLGPLLTGHSPSSPQSTLGNIEITIYGYFLAIDLCPITGDTTCGYGIKSILVGKKPCVITTDRDEFRLNRRQVSCTVPAGQGYATIEFESWDFGVALNTRTFTYAPPVITTISGYSGNTFLTQGGDMVISGTYFGTDPYVILSGYPSPLPNNVACPIKSLTDSAVSGAARITCTVPPGAGYNMLVYIRQCSNMQAQPCTYTYQASYSMAYRWPEHGPIPPALNTWGGQIITLTGANFGRCITADVDVYRKLTVAGALVSQKIGGVPTCNDTDPWWHNNMVVVTNRGSCGSNLPAITNYNQGNSWVSRYWQYKTGQINQNVAAHTLVTCGTGGWAATPSASQCSAYVTITGMYFGPPGAATITVTVGDGSAFTSEAVHLDEATGAAFKFKPPVGRGLGNQIKFSFCGSSGVSYYSLDYGWGLDYQPPTINTVQGTNLKCTGGDTITVNGINFGIQLFATKGDLSMFIDTGAGSFTPCLTPSISIDHTQAKCVVPANMMGQNMDFKLCLAGQCSIKTNSISFLAPVITSLQGGVPSTVGYSNFLTQGGEQLTINGANFGQDGSVTINGNPCAASAGPNWIDTRIVCTIPPGEGFNLRVLVTVAKGNYRADQKISVYVDTFSYAPPKVLKVTPNNGPTVGGIRTLVEGTNFGITSSIMIGGLPCTPIWLSTHTSVQCTTPIGEGMNRIVQIAVGPSGKERYNYTFAAASNFFFDLPVPQTPIPSNGATNGGNTITINGINFGTNNALISVNLHGNIIPGTSITLTKGTVASPTDKITFAVPESYGAHTPVYVTVAAQTSLQPVFYDYDPPRIDSLASTSCDTGTYPNVVNCDVKNNIPITINGANFGKVLPVTTVQLIDPRYPTRPTLCRPVNASCPTTNPACPPCTVDSVIHNKITITLPKKLDGGFNLTLRVIIDNQQTEQAWVSYAAPFLTSMSQPAGPGYLFPLTLEPTAITFKAKFLCSSEPGAGNYTVKIGLPTQSLDQKPFEWKGCSVASCVYLSEMQMTCTTPPSSIVGTGLTLQVKSDLLTSADSSWTMTTPQPVIIPNSIRASLNDEGSDILTSTINVASPICFNVSNVGDDPSKLTVEYFSNVTERYYNAYGISLTPGGNHEMQTLCCLGAKGDGKGYRFRVRALNYWSEKGTDVFNYPVPPEIISVFGCTDDHVMNTTHDCPTKAKDASGNGILLTIRANYIDANQLSCTIGSNDCKDPTYDADTKSFTCRLPEGTGIDLPVVVLHGALLSQPSYSVSYAKAVMTQIVGCDADPEGNVLSTVNCPRKYTDDISGVGRTITMTGTNFGKANSIVLVNGRQCTQVTHDAVTPHEKVTCRLPELMGQQRTLMFIQALGVIGDNQGSISYARCPPGTAFRKDGDLNCYVCELGTFAGQWGLMDCAGCESGTYADSTNMTVCNICQPGHYSYRVGELAPSGVTMGPVSCNTTTTGHFQNAPGQAQEQACKPGTYANATGMSQCTLCDKGYFQLAPTATYCDQCPLGQFTGFEGQATCDSCIAGTFNGQLAASACLQCQPSTYAGDKGWTACKNCSFGTVAESNGATACKECGAGQKANPLHTSCDGCPQGTFSAAKSESCTPCPIGQFGASAQSDKCMDCPIGSYSDQQMSTACRACSAGSYQGSLKGTECRLCEPGQYGAGSGLETCDSCPRGSYAAGNGSTSCILCPPGSYADSVQSTECKLCKPGYYSPSYGAEVCLECPSGSIGASNGTVQCTACTPGYMADSPKLATMCLPCAAGSYSDSPSSVACTSCPKGFMSSEEASISCDRCLAGTYTPTDGLSECWNCSVGTYSPNDGAFQCTKCPAGQIAPEERSTVCQLCPAGQYQESPMSSYCKFCDPGKYAMLPGQASCKACGTGTITNTTGAVECARCRAGFYQENTGASACVACRAGSYSNSEAATECFSCKVGQQQPLPAQTECFDCAAGKFQPAAGATYCGTCTAGTYSGQPASIGCEICQPGYVQPNASATRCIECDPGWYFDQTYGQICTSCRAGSYSGLPASTACIICQAGYVQPNASATRCVECNPGWFYGLPGGQECTICPAGEYASTAHSKECTICPQNQIAPHKGTPICAACQANAQADDRHLACKCAKGYAGKAVQRNETGVATVECMKCPQGARCDEEGLTVDTLETLSGWWSMGHGQNEFRAYYRCMMPSYCPGGAMPCGDSSSSPFVCASQCADYRESALCSLCKEGYTESVGGACRPCGNKGGSWAVAVIVCLAAIAAMWIMCYVVLYTSRSLFRSAEIEDAQRKNAEKGFVEDWVDDAQADTLRFGVLTVKGPPVPKPNFTFKMKIALGFLQIVTQQAVAIDIAWPAIFKTFLSWFNPINFDFLQLSGAGCVVTLGYFNKMKIFIAVPPVVVLVIVLLILVPTYIMRATMKSDDWQVTAKTARKKAWKLLFFVLFLIYPLVCASVLRFFVCRKIEGVDYLVADFTYTCDSSDWKDSAPLAWIFAFVYPIGIPAFFFACVFRYRKRLDEIGTRAQFDFLYDAYHHDYWWWEICDMAHKLILTALIAFFPFEAQMPIAMCIVVLYTMLILLCKPYVRKGDDMLHLFANLELFVLLLAGHIFNSLLEPDEIMMNVMGVILIIAVCIFFVYFLLQVVQVLMKWYKDNFKEKQRGGKREPEPDVDEDGLPVYKRSPPVTANLMRTGQNESLEMHRNRLFANTSVEMGNDVVHSELNMLSKDAQALKAIQDSRSQTNSTMTTTGANMSRGNPSATAPITTVSYQITQPTDTNTTATTDAGATTTPATTTVTPRAMDPFAAETELTSV